MSKPSQLVGQVFYRGDVSMMEGYLLTGIEAALFIAVNLQDGGIRTFTARDLAGYKWTTPERVREECRPIVRSQHREDSSARISAESALTTLNKVHVVKAASNESR